MVGIKASAIISSIVGFTLLSSNSARPMAGVRSEAPRATSIESFQATNDVHTSQSAATEAPHSHIYQQAGTNHEKEEEDSGVKIVEESLKELRRNRQPPKDDSPRDLEFGRRPSIDRSKVIEAVAWTEVGIGKEIEAYKALAQGRVADATQLSLDAWREQHQVQQLLNTHELRFLVEHEKVKKTSGNLEAELAKYESLPTKSELLAVIDSLDTNYPAKVVRPSSLKNEGTSTSVKDQVTSSSPTDQDTSKFVKHQETKPSLKNQDGPSLNEGPKESLLAKAVRLGSASLSSVNKSYMALLFTGYARVSKFQELMALKFLRLGDRANAVDCMKLMQHARKLALLTYDQYQKLGYGTIDLETYGAYGYSWLQKSLKEKRATVNTNQKISSQRLKEIKERLGLAD